MKIIDVSVCKKCEEVLSSAVFSHCPDCGAPTAEMAVPILIYLEHFKKEK